MGWTPETISQLETLWAEGLSASEIAIRLGGITRNAVIGKAHRMKLSGRKSCAGHKNSKPRKRKPPAVAKIPKFKPDKFQAAPEPEGKNRVTLLERRDDQCCWPIGEPNDPSFCFCGEKKHDHLHCLHHAQRYRRAA